MENESRQMHSALLPMLSSFPLGPPFLSLFPSLTFDEMDGGFQDLSSDTIHNNIDPLLRRCCDRYKGSYVLLLPSYSSVLIPAIFDTLTFHA